MALFRVQLAEATVGSLENLQTLWQLHGGPGTLLGRIVFTGKLSDEQLLSLSKDLRKLIVFEDECEERGDSVAFLERLLGLDDPRANEQIETVCELRQRYSARMTDQILILTVERDGDDGLLVTFSDGTTAGYLVDELLELRPHRQPIEPPRSQTDSPVY